ncbi:MAG TPA: protease pro-enzyme activation domain-containing protein [Terracidiphilus sp.]
MANLRTLPLCVLAAALFVPFTSLAQQARPQVRIAGPIDEDQLVTLKGNVHPAANAKNDRGPVRADLPMSDLVLVLSRSPEQQAAFDAFVESEYDPGSPNYHQWLTPDNVGQRFGPAQADISAITGWLTSQGFSVTHIAKDRMSISFSGTAGQVESAFHTSIHNLFVHGVPHIANMTNPQIPAALAPVVVGVKQLHDFHPHPLHKLGAKVQRDAATGKWRPVASAPGTSSTQSALAKSAMPIGPRPAFGINSPPSSNSLAYLEEDVTPYDFATIYNVQPLWTAGVTGTGQTIAIVGTSDIELSDVSNYRSAFGLPIGLAPEEVKGANGYDPGICASTAANAVCGLGDLEENSLDVEVSGGVATGAQIVLVTDGYNSQTAPTNDPIYQGAEYIIENIDNSSSPVYESHILSLSYGLCELYEGTSGNASYYSLWQTAAAEGISVFAATGDSGSPTCDDGGDAVGNPYPAQYGLSVSGIASTPWDTAVGGTDLAWCKPVYNSGGTAIAGCATSSTSQASPAYWNTSNAANGQSAAGYIPEIPWNDTCENPILFAFIASIAPLVSQNTGAATPTTPEESCNFVENNWATIDSNYGLDLSPFVDTIGGSGGASSCVVNSTSSDTIGTCSTSSTTVTTANGSVSLTNDGWQKPQWQTGVTGIPNDGVRDIPDLSFFAGNGSLNSATLICVSALGSCSDSNTVENTAQEVGGTSVGTPEMAGVMALINQKAGAPQGLPNRQLYQLAAKQSYSANGACSSESVKSSNTSCYFNDIDQGTNTMPCDLGAPVGGDTGAEYQGIVSPNCTAINSVDSGSVGTLVSSGTTPAYNASAGFDLATGLGSMNVANVVNAWISEAGTAPATLTATPSASTISANTALTLTVTVTGSSGTPTGSLAVTGGGATLSGTLSGGSATITIPANSLAVGADTLTVTYNGDSTYASATTTATVTVSAVTPTVAVTPEPASNNVANTLSVTVTVSGPLGSTTPTGTVTLASGSYSSTAVTLSSAGTATFTIPANTLAVGSDTLSATYSGSSTFSGATGTITVTIVGAATLPSTVKVITSPTSPDSSQSLTVSMTVNGNGAVPTGIVTLTASAGNYNSGPVVLTGGSASATIPAYTFSTGSVTLTAAYAGDSVYASGSGTATVTVTQSIYALAASAASPATISPGATATSTITGTTSSTDYTGTVALNSCTATNGPANAANVPTCSASGTITYASGMATGSGTATVTTMSNTALLQTEPGSKGWLGAGGGTVLAFLVFLGIPARRRSWRAMLGILVLLTALGSLSACGGGTAGGSSGGTGSTATTPGAYTFTVTGTGNDPAKTSESVTFTLTVN